MELRKVAESDFGTLAESLRRGIPHSLPALHWLSFRRREESVFADAEISADDVGSPSAVVTFHRDPLFNGANHVHFDLKDSASADDFSSALSQVLDRYPIKAHNSLFHILPWGLIPELRRQLEPFGTIRPLSSTPCPMFYMVPEKVAELMQMDLSPPTGLHFETLRFTDIPFMNSTWPHKFEGSELLLEKRLHYFPSIGLRTDAADELVSFESIEYPFGLMSHLYTVPEHRGKRLAPLVELKLAQVLVKAGHHPYKFVVSENVDGLRITFRDGWWEEARREVGWVFYTPHP